MRVARNRRRHPKKTAMLAALAKTGNVSASARAAGIDRATHYKWLYADDEYAEAVQVAIEDAVDVLEAVARQRALHGSDILLIFLLKGHRPEKYRDRYEVRHDGRLKVDQHQDGFEILRDPVMRQALDDYHDRKQIAEWEEGGRVGPRPWTPAALALPPPR